MGDRKMVGFVGLGKLGLPCALTLDRWSDYGVIGTDVSDDPKLILDGTVKPPREEGIEDLLDGHGVVFTKSMAEVVREAHGDTEGEPGVVFVAVQTPHDRQFGGEFPMPEERKDFEYAWLTAACREVCMEAEKQKKKTVMVVISTVLPGTMNRHVRPLLNKYVTLVYSPLFIAMGTVVNDYLSPEFVLMGADDDRKADPVRDVYDSLHQAEIVVMGVESAELTKVAYNTFISMKVVFGNTMMEMCEKTGADCDDVIAALAKATDRIVSPRYMQGGMGDGGGCHPRDNIAMSWLAERLDMWANPFEFVTAAREAQSMWLASMAVEWANRRVLPIVILGKAYKPETNLMSGSPGLLLARQIEELGFKPTHWDPYLDRKKQPTEEAVYFIATKHEDFGNLMVAKGSIVLDPFGLVGDIPGVTVIRIGRKR